MTTETGIAWKYLTGNIYKFYSSSLIDDDINFLSVLYANEVVQSRNWWIAFIWLASFRKSTVNFAAQLHDYLQIQAVAHRNWYFFIFWKNFNIKSCKKFLCLLNDKVILFSFLGDEICKLKKWSKLIIKYKLQKLTLTLVDYQVQDFFSFS